MAPGEPPNSLIQGVTRTASGAFLEVLPLIAWTAQKAMSPSRDFDRHCKFKQSKAPAKGANKGDTWRDADCSKAVQESGNFKIWLTLPQRSLEWQSLNWTEFQVILCSQTLRHQNFPHTSTSHLSGMTRLTSWFFFSPKFLRIRPRDQICNALTGSTSTVIQNIQNDL